MPPILGVFVCLMTLSLPAVPVPKNAVPVSLGPAPLVELVSEGCSPGWQRGHWQDASGEWHWSHCFPSWR